IPLSHSRRPPPPTRLPYTTLFRSHDREPSGPCRRGPPSPHVQRVVRRQPDSADATPHHASNRRFRGHMRHWEPTVRWVYGVRARSEEHTSELQSREKLVCRLLLEK